MNEFPEFIAALPEVEMPFEGLTARLLQGEGQQVVFLYADRDTDVPEHSHRAQWELVLDGEAVLTMGGKERSYRRGESFYIPEGVPHSATVRAGYRAIMFFDQADRYRAKPPAS
jgi:quercetin dioxygenase-like cupin family protein